MYSAFNEFYLVLIQVFNSEQVLLVNIIGQCVYFLEEMAEGVVKVTPSQLIIFLVFYCVQEFFTYVPVILKILEPFYMNVLIDSSYLCQIPSNYMV